MNTDFISGRWVITHTADFSPRQILDYLPALQDTLDSGLLSRRTIQVDFSTRYPDNRLWTGGETVSLEIRELSTAALLPADKPQESPPFPGPWQHLEHITHLLLHRSTDSRWSSIELTAASLYLGSELVRRGYGFSVRKAGLDSPDIPLKADLLALTLFEELLPETREFLAKRLSGFRGMLAAGGPLVTLQGAGAVYHLPRINLFIRGEADLAFPRWIAAWNRKNLRDLLAVKGFFFRLPGTMIFSDFHTRHRIDSLTTLRPSAAFIPQATRNRGLEINLTRGCSRRCIYCSRVHGSGFRRLPASAFDRLLRQWSRGSSSADPPENRSININDDDLLQDPLYTRKILATIRKRKFRLFGLQSSLACFFSGESVRKGLLELIADPDLFVGGKPLVWIGTDAFLPLRGPRLGKFVPSGDSFQNLLRQFEERRILNYHYWISSDHLGGWGQFIEEFRRLWLYRERYPRFQVLAHAPFLVPYASTPLYSLLQAGTEKNRIRCRETLRSGHPWYHLPVVSRVDTPFENLNLLLENRSVPGHTGFFEAFRKGDHRGCCRIIYDFLKRDRLLRESDPGPPKPVVSRLRELEKKVSDLLASGPEEI